jgi:uncharacterized LabA/DUF88 family protein
VGNCALIDGQNLYLETKRSDWVLDYSRFRAYLKDKYAVEKAVIFLGFLPSQVELYTKLASYGYELSFRPVLRNNSIIKGNVDVDLAVYAFDHLDEFDQLILISNDGDFYNLVASMVNKGKFLRLMTPSNRYSALFREFSEYIISLESLKAKISKRK